MPLRAKTIGDTPMKHPLALFSFFIFVFASSFVRADDDSAAKAIDTGAIAANGASAAKQARGLG